MQPFLLTLLTFVANIHIILCITNTQGEIALDFIIKLYSYLQEFTIISIILRLILSVILGGLIGFEREHHGRAAGLRTHILVCLGSAIATLIGHYAFVKLAFTGDPLRIGAQVLSGIGFLGAGTIISRGRFQVTGLTTAACLWTTAAIGLAIGIGFYSAAVIGCALVVLTMALLTKFDATIIKRSHKLRVYMEINDVTHVNEITEMLSEVYNGKNTQITGPRSTISGNCGIETTIHVTSEADGKNVLKTLSEHKYVVFALPSI